MAVFFTRKSHAAIYVASKYLICRKKQHASGIFDSHHPLQFPAIDVTVDQIWIKPLARSLHARGQAPSSISMRADKISCTALYTLTMKTWAEAGIRPPNRAYGTLALCSR
jgi:hypothetical protein